MNTERKKGTVHWIENVDGDPGTMQTACGRFRWNVDKKLLLDPNRTPIYPITCLECLTEMAKPCHTVNLRPSMDSTTAGR